MNRPWIALGLGVLPSLVALAITAGTAPTRTMGGIFFTLAIVPAVELLVSAFLGWSAAVAVGATAAGLTLWLCLGTPPGVSQQDPRWTAVLADSTYSAQSSLAPPARSRAARALEEGARGFLFVCALGDSPEMEVRLAGRVLVPAPSPPGPSAGPCWRPYAVPSDLLAQRPAVLEAQVTGRSGSIEIVGGYTKPRARGGQSGGAMLVEGGRARHDDLSPSTRGAQTGRYWVELRVIDGAGRLVEIWF